MIWSVVTKEEMEGYGTSPVFRFYREAIGKDNIKLAVVDENDPLDFVGPNDIVLLRSANEHLINTIERKEIKSTAENYLLYVLVQDKASLAEILDRHFILVPNQYGIEEVEDGKSYFVKPCFGSDSFGISLKSVCRTALEVHSRVDYIKEELGQPAVIEDYIEGIDCTVACYRQPSGLIIAQAMEIECEETKGIQTRDCKVGFKECCIPLKDDKGTELHNVAREVCELLNIRHHARIDFRKDKEGNLFLIDVNLMPGLGPLDHYAKCWLLTSNMSYTDAIKTVIESASISSISA